MKYLAGFLAISLLPLSSQARVDPKARSVSNSRQFIVFCEDAAVRGRVAGFVEEVKRDVLTVLGAEDRWRIPVVISIESSSAPVPVKLSFVQTPEGPSIQLGVWVGEDPAAIHLQRHIVRAVMLDFIYRDRPMPRAGTVYAEAPWWFIDGVVETVRERNGGLNAGLYRRLVETNKLPPIADFLAGHGSQLGPTAAAFDAALARAFLQLLLEQPEGRSRLTGMMRTWADASTDPVAAVCAAFPTLGTDSNALQKWWTLNLARFAASDRSRGMEALATDAKLGELLEFDVQLDKNGSKERFAVGQFMEWIKKPGAKAAAARQQKEVIKLSATANVLMAPVLSGYEEVFSMLARGKTRGVAERIEQVEKYRETVLHRSDDIANYLNWYEATQLGIRSGAFESFFRAADAAEAQPKRTETARAIGDYLDNIEQAF